MTFTHVVTGATGLVGGALVLELLQRAPGEILCLVRPRGGDATARLHESLLRAAECYGAPSSVHRAIVERCRAVAGDVAEPGCGVTQSESAPLAQFWHSAASLRFEDRHADEIHRSNVGGTAHALEWAARLGATQFNHVSTAYVAGSNEGRILEAPPPGGEPNNHYEASKVRAEELVVADTRFGRRIFRPSVVMGHSQTLGATNFASLYGLAQKLRVFKRVIARARAGVAQPKNMRVRLDADAVLDLVPVDRVVANAVTIALETNPAPGQLDYYHLSNPKAPPMGVAIGTVFEVAGLSPPIFTRDEGEFDPIDEKFAKGFAFYNGYFVGHKIFDRANVERLVGEEPPGVYDMSAEVIAKYLRWYIDTCDEERREKRARRTSPREERSSTHTLPRTPGGGSPPPAPPTRGYPPLDPDQAGPGPRVEGSKGPFEEERGKAVAGHASQTSRAAVSPIGDGAV